MNELENVINGLECCSKGDCADCDNCTYRGVKTDVPCESTLMRDALALLKAQQARIMTLDLPPSEWEDKVIWLEVKGEKPVPALFKRCSDGMLFGHYDRLMYFDRVGYIYERGYVLRNYGVKWRCWTSRPTDEQREAVKWR